MIGSSDIAGTSPRDLLRQGHFWRAQRVFVIVSGLGLLTVFLLFPYTYAAAGGWEIVSLAVHALAMWAAVITAKGLATLEVEKAIVIEIERNGTEYLRDVKSGQRPRIDLDQLEQVVVPNNTSQPQPAMIRLFQHIIKEARDRKFESSVNVMQTYREEPLEDLFKLQNLQKIALWLGILGTFIGLLLAISAADLTSEDFLAIVQKMFAGLVVSFSASLVGLQVAVFIGVLLLLLRKGQERYFKLMETAVVTMLSLARNAINKDDFLAEFSQITATIDALTTKVHEQTAETSRRMEATREEIGGQTEAIRAGMDKLHGARGTFDGFLKNISDSQSQFIGDIRSVYDTISLQRLSETLHESLSHAGRLMSDTLSLGTRQISNRLVDFNKSVDVLSQALEAQAHESAEHSRALATQLQASTSETTNAMKFVVTRMQEMLQREVSVRGELTELSRKIAMLANSIDRLDHIAAPRSRGLRDILTLFRW